MRFWLARRGWTVTAIDVSDVAVSRAREAADVADAVAECVCGDALETHIADVVLRARRR